MVEKIRDEEFQAANTNRKVDGGGPTGQEPLQNTVIDHPVEAAVLDPPHTSVKAGLGCDRGRCRVGGVVADGYPVDTGQGEGETGRRSPRRSSSRDRPWRRGGRRPVMP
jgi:hypothetical protein